MTEFPHSEAANAPAPRSEKDRVWILDTTLRDGEQSPGATMTHDEKLEVAVLLDQMGVDIIEAGFPAASNGDFEAVAEIAKLVKNAVVSGLARGNDKDIDRAGEAVRHAKRGRIHTFIGTSPIHRQYQLQMSAEQVFEKVVASVTRARSHTDDVEWSAMDATRTEPDFLCRVRRGRDQGRRHHDQHPRHGRLHRAGGDARDDQDAARARAGRGQGDLLDALPRRSGPGRRQQPGGRAGRARGRSSAPSTAWANARATRRWKRS